MLELSPELEKIARAFCPIVSFHPQERFLPCGVEFFYERCHLRQRKTDLDEIATIIPRGEITPDKISSATANAALPDGYFLELTEPSDQTGISSGPLSTVPVMCHIKRVLGPNTDVLELNYMFLFAHSGAYIIFGQETGAHDGDWEHITVRADPYTGALIAVYYSAHRHGDGTWVPARKVPFDQASGRLVAFCAVNGHGMHPQSGRTLRVFGLANDVTSAAGRRWSSRRCVIVVPPGQHAKGPLTLNDLPEVSDRGAQHTKPWQGTAPRLQLPAPALGFNDGAVPVTEVEVEVREAPFLEWSLRWGTVVSPQLQRWFKHAEHPSGSTTFRRVALPCIRQ
eukprot:jgi/Ulvmu1/3082/UM015_0122.1